MRTTFFLLIAILFIHVSAKATVVVVAPHPDDAEASCGGLILNTVNEGEEVIILTMTGGERGIPGKSDEEARKIREAEARKAAEASGAKVEFFGGLDARLEVTIENTQKLKKLLSNYKPRVALAPWPMDVHPDHQASGLLAWRAFLDKNAGFELYFYETSNDPHTKTFQFVPTDYIDITDVIKKKWNALFQHKSQFPKLWYQMYELMEKDHGYAADTSFAEGYIKARNFSSLGGRPGATPKTFSTKK